MNRLNLLFALLFVCNPLLAEDDSGTLKLSVTGGHPHRGQAIVSLFGSAESFLKELLFRQVQAFTDQPYLEFTFTALPYGSYAISVVYDEDSDNELDTGWFVIPTEPVGISNNAKGKFGPPDFADAVFRFDREMSVNISLGAVK